MDLKAICFGILVVSAYVVHQVTVGGDGIVFASVIGALLAVGGYAYRRAEERLS